MKKLITCLIVMTAFGVAAATITLDTSSLPSTQGWEYTANGLHAGTTEADLVSTDGTVLTVNTMGQPTGYSSGAGALYIQSDAVINSMPTTIEWTSRTLDHEGYPGGYYGFCVGFRTSTMDYSAGIFPDRVEIRDGSGWREIPLNATEYHTYRIETVTGSLSYDFYIDDVLRATAKPRENHLLNNFVFFGDGTRRQNANSEITSLVFQQVSFEIGLSDPLNTEGCVEATCPEGAVVHLFAEESAPSPSKTYLWITSSGDAGSGETFEFIVGVDQQATVSLTVEDSATGESSTVTKTVCVSDTTAPEIVIISPMNGDVITGRSLGMEVQITDAVDQEISEYLVSFCNSYWAPLDPDGTSKIQLFMPDKGTEPVPTDMIVSAQDISGNACSATVQVLLQHDRRIK